MKLVENLYICKKNIRKLNKTKKKDLYTISFCKMFINSFDGFEALGCI